MNCFGAYLKQLEKLRREPLEGEKRQAKHATHPIGRLKTKAMLNGFVSKYQNRRSQLLKCANPMRTPNQISRISTKKMVWDGKNCFRSGKLTRICSTKILGDIVAIKNSRDMKQYFAQITNFVSDQHANDYAFLVWLMPLDSASHRHKFKAEHFEHAFADEHPYPIEVLSFVQSCPPLLNYAKRWTPNVQIREQLQKEICSRFEALQKAANEELSNMRSDFKKNA